MKNQPGTIKTDLEPLKTNLEPWITTKTNRESLKTNLEPWITMFDRKGRERGRNKQKRYRYFIYCKNWTESDWLNHTIQGFLQQHFSVSATSFWSKKRDVTNTGPQPTSFGAKTLRHEHGATTDLLWSKNLTSRTRGPNRPFRCLDLLTVCY